MHSVVIFLRRKAYYFYIVQWAHTWGRVAAGAGRRGSLIVLGYMYKGKKYSTEVNTH